MSEHHEDLADFVAASPSSYHAADEVARRLTESGFSTVDESQSFPAEPGNYVVIRDGAVIAWRIPESATPTTGFRVVGAHTDSPGLKVKPTADSRRYGWQQVAVEIYGGPLLNSWLDRDLGIAGRIVGRDGRHHLVRTEAVMRVPQLAIHLDRDVNDKGLHLNRQTHTQPIWGIAAPSVAEHLASLAGIGADEIAGHDLISFDTQRPEVIGAAGEFLASSRLDNLSSVHAGLVALQGSAQAQQISVLAAFDHEEVGSQTRSGACGPFLEDVLRGITHALGGSPDDFRRAISRSYCVSADAGHGVHPNYPERHDPTHLPMLGGGPMLKVNANQRYASDGDGAAMWRRACADAGVPTQDFISNNAMPCGSTIGPLTATRLGIRTVDVGIALLSMHSAREMCAVQDPAHLAGALGAFYSLEWPASDPA